MHQTIYKLTDENMQTCNEFQWELNKPYTTEGNGPLCSDKWLHAYTDPVLPAFLNPIHADFPKETMRLFRGTGVVGATDCGLMVGCTQITLEEELKPQNPTQTQNVAFGILCAIHTLDNTQLAFYTKNQWLQWANKFLSGEDREPITADRLRIHLASYGGNFFYTAAYPALSAAQWCGFFSFEHLPPNYAALAAERAARVLKGNIDLPNIARTALEHF